MKKNILPTGRINVYGVHKKADVTVLGQPGKSLEQSYREYDGDFIDLVLFVLLKLYESRSIGAFEAVVAYSYFTTSLVHKTIAERIIIEDDSGNVRYMSKQNVHQNIIRKVIDLIIDYTKEYMPSEFQTYFPETHRLGHHEDEAEIYSMEDSCTSGEVSGTIPEAVSGFISDVVHNIASGTTIAVFAAA